MGTLTIADQTCGAKILSTHPQGNTLVISVANKSYALDMPNLIVSILSEYVNISVQDKGGRYENCKVLSMGLLDSLEVIFYLNYEKAVGRIRTIRPFVDLHDLQTVVELNEKFGLVENINSPIFVKNQKKHLTFLMIPLTLEEQIYVLYNGDEETLQEEDFLCSYKYNASKGHCDLTTQDEEVVKEFLGVVCHA